MHGRGDLIGFHFLAVDPGARLLGHGREFFRCAGYLRYTLADSANQLAQALGHALNRLLELPQFVTPVCASVLGQITGRHVLDGLEGVLQRNNDLSGDGPCGHDAHY